MKMKNNVKYENNDVLLISYFIIPANGNKKNNISIISFILENKKINNATTNTIYEKAG